MAWIFPPPPSVGVWSGGVVLPTAKSVHVGATWIFPLAPPPPSAGRWPCGVDRPAVAMSVHVGAAWPFPPPPPVPSASRCRSSVGPPTALSAAAFGVTTWTCPPPPPLPCAGGWPREAPTAMECEEECWRVAPSRPSRGDGTCSRIWPEREGEVDADAMAVAIEMRLSSLVRFKNQRLAGEFLMFFRCLSQFDRSIKHCDFSCLMARSVVCGCFAAGGDGALLIMIQGKAGDEHTDGVWLWPHHSVSSCFRLAFQAHRKVYVALLVILPGQVKLVPRVNRSKLEASVRSRARAKD